MKYATKGYIGFGLLGVASPGEVLTDEQANSLGEERLHELMAGGRIIPLRDDPPATSSVAKEPEPKPEGPKGEPLAEEAPAEETDVEDPGDMLEGDTFQDMGNDIVMEAEAPALAQPKRSTRKNTTKKGEKKNENPAAEE